MAISVGDVIRVVYFQRLFGQRIDSVFHLRCTVAPAPGTTEAQALLNIAIRFSDPTFPLLMFWAPLVGPSLLFDEVRAQKVWPNRSVYQKFAIGTTGTNADDATTANVAASIEKRTLHPGRKGIGRWQIAGVPATKIISGALAPSYLTSLSGLAGALVGDQSITSDSSKYRFCLWNGGAITSDDDMFDPQPKDTVRTMRRRTLRVGE